MKLLNIFIIFLLFINFINCQISFQFEDSSQTPDNNNFLRYINYYGSPISNSKCSIQVKFWAIQNDGNGIMQSQVLIESSLVGLELLGSNLTHFYYQTPGNAYATVNTTGYIQVNVSGANDFKNTLNINYQCLDYDADSFNIKPLGFFYDNTFGGPVFLLKADTPPNVSMLPIYINDTQISNSLMDSNHYFLLISYYFNTLTQPIGETLKIDIVFSSATKSIIVPNYYDSSFYDNDILIDYYPQNNTNVELMGRSSYPLFILQSKTQTKSIFPFYVLTINPFGGYAFLFKPIYENSCVTTYMVSPYTQYFMYVQPPYEISLYAQEYNSIYKASSISYSLTDLPVSLIKISDIGYSIVLNESIPLVNIGAYTGEPYLLNVNTFGLSNSILNTIAPFGFCNNGVGSDNSNYMFNITFPISKSSWSLSFKVQQSQIGLNVNTYNATYIKPKLAKYSVEQITNNKYLFKISITSNCEFGFYSFNPSADYYSMSPYRVSGDEFNGDYEIIYDSDIEVGFNTLYIYDLCSDQIMISNNGYFTNYQDQIQETPVPFKNFDFSVYDLTNITYLYNNIDCSRQSVANTIYFTHPTIDISKAQIALRLPGYININQNAFFTNEFYGFWNSLINKYQIDFVIPKNSQPGNFSFSLAIDQINQYPSDIFPANQQLLIKKSYFDGIGPIFTYIEKLPYQTNNNNGNQQFGWKLNISDPINGFDNGTITVMGSMDNSIYKFDLLPSNMIAGDIYQGTWEIIIQVDKNSCVNQNYSITFVKLYDTGAQFSVFELATASSSQIPNQLNNPLYLYFNDSTINKYEITCNNPNKDLNPPFINSFTSSVSTIDVGAVNRNITFTLEVYDDESGINILAQGPSIYLIGGNLEVVQCISKLDSYLDGTAIFTCTVEVPIGFASSIGVFTVSVYGIINNHGLYNGYSSEMLKSYSLTYKIPVTFTSNAPLLLNSGRASSKGGQFFIYGRVLSDVQKVTITDIVTNQSKDYTTINHYGSNVVSIPNLNAIEHKFKVTVTSKSGITSNSILVSPYLFLDFVPYSDSDRFIDDGCDTGSSSSSSTPIPIPTNAPQKCTGNPVCGGPSKGYCNITTGCICIYPYYGKDCLSEIIDTTPPVVDPNEPSTSIEIPNNNSTDNNGNQVDIVHYKSLVSIVSLREININGNIVKNYPFNKNWVSTELSSLKTLYLTKVTDSNNNLITTVSATLEWFNQSKTINFAEQDIKMNPNSIKYTINISEYPFMNSLNSLQLVMSATFESNSSYSCSLKDYGDTSTGDNSNYIKIQVDNKSLYGRFIKRGIVDDNKIVSLSNQLLDSSLNAISSPSQSQSYIGITIPKYNKNCIIDPDFSVLLDSNSASSNSNSVCRSSGGLSGSKIAGIVIGSVAFVAVIVVSVAYYFKRKNDDKKLKTNIEKKLSQMN